MNRRTELAIYAVSGLMLAGTAALWWQGIRPSPNLPPALEVASVVEEATAEAPKAPPPIFVHIDGAVEEPGVYEFPAGQRLFGALELVGVLPEADLSSLNLASVLRDAQKIHVPLNGEAPQSQTSSQSGQSDRQAYADGAQAPFPINVNTAIQAELERLPGVGPVIARAIIARREAVGPFQRPEDLKDVNGIGDRTLQKLLPYVTIE